MRTCCPILSAAACTTGSSERVWAAVGSTNMATSCADGTSSCSSSCRLGVSTSAKASSHVACWAAEVGDEAKVDRIGTGHEYGWNGCGRRLGGERCWRSEGGDDGDLTTSQIGG